MVTNRFFSRLLSRSIFLFVLPILGCGDVTFPAYDSAREYGLRADPVFADGSRPKNEFIASIDPMNTLPILDFHKFRDPALPYAGETEFIENNLDKKVKDPSKVPGDVKTVLGQILKEWFGTPARPRVNYDNLLTGKDFDAANDRLGFDAGTLAKGSMLYRVHCLHCHGVNGDGRGITATWVNPHPRDYRQMQYKFVSLKVPSDPNAQTPSRKDLRRTIEYGLEGTSMPAFGMLPPEEIEALVSYVMHLSVRGYVEYKAIDSLSFDGKLLMIPDEVKDIPFDTADNKAKWRTELGKLWSDHYRRALDRFVEVNDPAAEPKIAPYELAFTPQSRSLQEYVNLKVKGQNLNGAERQKLDDGKADFDAFAQSVKEGYEIFMDSKRGACKTCHINFGKDAKYRFDTWGTLVRPRDLTLGQYRGGRRATDLYNRILLGIAPSGMGAYQAYFEKNPKDVWKVVNFIQLLPYPAMLRECGVNPIDSPTPQPPAAAAAQ